MITKEIGERHRFFLDCIPVSVYNEPMYSVKDAAQRLGLDTSQVRRLLAKGEIKGVKLARDWVVLELTYKRKRKPKGYSK
jgi:excisionase family DNA binding protein